MHMHARAQVGASCLHVAVFAGHLDVIKYLCELNDGKLVCLKDKSGMSPLRFARATKHSALVKYLKSATARAQQ